MKKNNQEALLTRIACDAFTMADRLARTSRECRTKYKLVFCELSKTSRFHNGLVGLRSAFTMAEILLSLTIIGVVATITLPFLTSNINERTWNTQRKALYARMSQAISLMPALNGYGTISAAVGTEGEEGYVAPVDTAAETFITAGLSKVMKINNICDNTHLEDCGIPTTYTDMLGSNKSLPTTLYSLSEKFSLVRAQVGCSYSTNDTKAVAFETQNGESIVAYYNQTCRTEYLNETLKTVNGDAFGFPQATMCVNFIYDLNGSKGPNTVGKDIGFITVFNATDSNIVAPMPSSAKNAGNSTNYSKRAAAQACTNEDSESRIPNIDELSAMYINTKLVNLTGEISLMSGTMSTTIGKHWTILLGSGMRGENPESTARPVRCIKR